VVTNVASGLPSVPSHRGKKHAGPTVRVRTTGTGGAGKEDEPGLSFRLLRIWQILKSQSSIVALCSKHTRALRY
jgi:hypothetical protein